MEGQSSRRERKRGETRDRIISAAMRLFGERGLLATKIEEITEAADVAKGTFFNYFTSKEEILLVFAQRMRAGIAPRISEAMSTGQRVEPALRETVRQIVKVTHPGPALMKSLFTSLLSNDKVLEVWLSEEKHIIDMLSGLFRYGQERGEIRSDLKPQEIAMRFRQTIVGSLLFWVIHQPSQAEEWIDPSINLFFNACCAGTRPLEVSGPSVPPQSS
jgi:AcrR family transcriptional regulator